MNNNKIFIEILIKLIFCFKSISTKCGLPSIPFNAQINQVKHSYNQEDFIKYNCELEGLKLVGPSTRICRNGRWIGAIPRCVEKLDEKVINSFQIADAQNHTIKYDKTIMYHTNYTRGECIESSKMTRPHIWRFFLTKHERHISYIEIKVLNKNNSFNKNLIDSVKVNDLRECESQLMGFSNESLQFNVTCSLEFNLSTEHDDWENDQADMIDMGFNTNEITICEINIYKTSHRVHHWCGSADVVLNSKRMFIRSNERYAGNSHYRYKCDQGFKLNGNQDVRCGVDNNWLDEFPKCEPVVTCPLKLNDQVIGHSKSTNLYESQTNVTFNVGSIVYYSCKVNHKSIMIGDSLRVCDPEGDWSGINPICISADEMGDYLEEIQDIDKYELDGYESFDDSYDKREQLACGIPAMPLFAKPITQLQFKSVNRHADLRSSYPNGTVIGYQCESAYVFVTGDLEQRTCLDGKWVGKIGKCAINLGKNAILNSIILSHGEVQGDSITQIIDYIEEVNSTDSNENYVFKYDPGKEGGQGYTFAIDRKHQWTRWTIRLNKPVEISYFMVMLHPGGFFNNITHLTDPKTLLSSPISAKSNDKECILTSAWDLNNLNTGTYFHFTCDQGNSLPADHSDIILDFDPNRIRKSYLATNVSLCYLAVFTSKNKCGTPDIPIHGSVLENPLTSTWTYSCDQDFELVGHSTVKCSSNGQWMGDFPTCRKKSACTISSDQELSHILVRYTNFMEINGKSTAVIDSMANYSCNMISGPKTILIGSKIRVCYRFKGYKWSGSEPFCLDPAKLSKYEAPTGFFEKFLPIILIIIVFMLFIVVIAIVVWIRMKNKLSDHVIDNNNINSLYSL